MCERGLLDPNDVRVCPIMGLSLVHLCGAFDSLCDLVFHRYLGLPVLERGWTDSLHAEDVPQDIHTSPGLCLTGLPALTLGQ